LRATRPSPGRWPCSLRRYRLPRSRRLGGRGESFAFEASDVHRVSHAGGAPALTVHLYSPPLRQMEAYLIEPSGLVRRITISHEQELRPLTPA